MDANGLKKMSQKLQEKTPIVPYAKVIDPIQEINILMTVVGVVAKGSLSDMQLNDNSLQPVIPPDIIPMFTYYMY